MPNVELADRHYRIFDVIVNGWRGAPKKKRSDWKRKFTDFVNAIAIASGPVLTRKSLLAYVQLLKLEKPECEILGLISDRLSCRLGHFYFENHIAYGWVSESQPQAIPIPIKKEKAIAVVSFRRVQNDWRVWQGLGFYEPEPLPLIHNGFYWEVVEDREDLGYGVAIAIPLERLWFPYRLEVVMSYRAMGYWKAYKIWDGCQQWYREKKLYLEGEVDNETIFLLGR